MPTDKAVELYEKIEGLLKKLNISDKKIQELKAPHIEQITQLKTELKKKD